jgi:hypothetical protein
MVDCAFQCAQDNHLPGLYLAERLVRRLGGVHTWFCRRQERDAGGGRHTRKSGNCGADRHGYFWLPASRGGALRLLRPLLWHVQLEFRAHYQIGEQFGRATRRQGVRSRDRNGGERGSLLRWVDVRLLDGAHGGKSARSRRQTWGYFGTRHLLHRVPNEQRPAQAERFARGTYRQTSTFQLSIPWVTVLVPPPELLLRK